MFFFHIYFCILKGVASSLMKYIVVGIFSIFFFNQVEEFGVKFMPMSFRDFVINIYLSDLFDFKNR